MADGLDNVPVLTSGGSAGLVAQQVALQKIADAQARIARSGAVGQGVDPDYVHTFEHFDGMSHQAMYDGVHGATGLDPAALQSTRAEFHAAYSELVNASTFAKMGIARVFGSGALRGVSSEAGEAAAGLLLDAVQEMGRVVGSVTDRIDAASWAAEAVRLAVGPPPADVTLRPDPDNPAESVLPGLPNGALVQTSDEAAEQQRLAAAAVLNRTYKGEFLPPSAQVPAFVAAPQVGGDGLSGTPNTAGAQTDPGGAPGNVPTAQGPETPATPNVDVPTESSPGLDTSAVTAAGTDLAQSLLSGTSPASAATAPSGTAAAPGVESPAAAGRPGSTLGSGGVGGVPGGSPSQLLGGAVPGSPTAGKAAPVSGGVPGSAGGAGRGSGSAAGRPMGAGGPMAPGAAGRSKGQGQEGDSTHSSPEYLRMVDPEWTSSLPPVPVPVIGQDDGTRPVPDSVRLLNSPTPVSPPVVPTANHVERAPVAADEASPPVAAQSAAPAAPAAAASAAPVRDEHTAQNATVDAAEPESEPVQVPISEGETVTAARLAEILRAAGGSDSVVLSGAGPAMAEWEQPPADDNPSARQ